MFRDMLAGRKAVIWQLALVVGWTAAALAALPADAKERSAGLDVVVLVDVSGSMFEYPKTETSPRRDGNDRERLRWDAVKLVIDLLGEEDRIAILPFNAHCPARLDEQPESRRLPGALPDRLEPLTDQRRRELSGQVLSFIVEDNSRPYDSGSTGILDALGAARDRIQRAKRPNREAVVILLTDGEQDTGTYGEVDSPDDKLVASGRWGNDERVFYFREEGIKVYPFGLGQNADMKFLRDLALYTNSAELAVADNGALVTTFRSLIWSLRDCWPFPIDPADPATLSSRSLNGVLELGVSMSELETRPAKQRNTFAPSTPPRQVWSDGEAATPKWRALGKAFDNINGRRRTSGHAYSFYDGRETSRDPLGALFQRHPQRELTLNFDATPAQEQAKVSGFWVKRPDLTFELILPDVTFYRHQPIPVEVRMYDWGNHFASDDFEVTARIVSVEDPSQKFAAVLQSVGGNVFRADTRFTAASLSPSTEFEDNYTLQVEVRNPKLSPAPHFVPQRSIIVKNVLPLLPPDPGLALHREKQMLNPITVEPKFPVRDNLPVLMETVSPRAIGNQPPLPEDLFEYGPSPGTMGGLNLRGELAWRSGFARADRYPREFMPRANFAFCAVPETNLRLAVWGANEKEERENLYVVPFGLRMDTIGIGFSFVTRPLSVGPRRPQDSLTVTLKQIDGPRQGQPADPNQDQSLTLEIVPRDKEQLVFAPQELWVQPSGDGPVEAASRRTSSRLKQISEPITLFFQPDPSKHADQELLIGEHTYVLKAGGPRFDPVEQEVTLIVQPPQLEARPLRHSPLYAKPGGVTSAVRFQTRLDWLPGGRLNVSLRGYPKIRFLDLSTDSIVGDNYELAYRGVKESVLSLQSPVSRAADGWTDLELELAVPADMRFGNYQGRLELAHKNQLLRALEIPLNVDAIYLLHPVIPADKQQRFRDVQVTELPVARRSSQLKLTQYFDHPAKVTVEIRSELAGNPLDPQRLGVSMARPTDGPKIACLVNANDPTDYVRAPVAGPARLVAGNLQVDLKFPEIRNATPGIAYTGTLLLDYRDPSAARDLGQRSVPISVTFLEARQVIRTGDQ